MMPWYACQIVDLTPEFQPVSAKVGLLEQQRNTGEIAELDAGDRLRPAILRYGS